MREPMKMTAVVALIASLVACGGPEPRVAAPPSLPPPSASAADAAAAPASDAGADRELEPASAGPKLEPMGERPAPKPLPHVEILFPFAEQRVAVPKAKTYAVRVKVESWPLGEEGAGVALKLDDGRPRRLVPGGVIKLGDLVRDGAELKPGAHLLTAVALDADGSIVRSGPSSLAPFAAVRFWVGDKDPNAKAPEPKVLMFSPSGTYNGARAADALFVDFLAMPERTGVEGGSALVRLSGRGFAPVEQRLVKWQPLLVRDAPNGDLEVEVLLFDKSGAPIPGARATATITVNRDAPVAPPKP